MSAWASAYELGLLEDLAQHSVRRFTVAVALTLLPTGGTPGELFLGATLDHDHGELSSVARLRRDQEFGPWFALDARIESESEGHTQTRVRRAALALQETLPPGTWHAEFRATADALCFLRVRPANASTSPARWLAWDGEFGAASTHFGRSLLQHFEERMARRVLEDLGVGSRRKAPWIASVQGRTYLNLSSLESLAGALDASRTLLAALSGGPLGPMVIEKGQRFRAPRLLAELALLDSRLRARVRQFQALSLGHARWFEELDLAILPDDALPTTLRETRHFVATAGALYLETELGLIRALSGLSDLGSDGEKFDLGQLFPTLIVADELASVAHSEDLHAALSALDADPAARQSLARGVRSVEDLPEGRAKRELSYHRRQHGFWTDSAEFAGRTLAEDERAFLELLLALRPLAVEERTRRKQNVLAIRQAAARLLSGNHGWLGRQALNALLERVSSFVRMHEELRVTLARSYSLLRVAILDAGRRLARLNPALSPDAVWHLDFDELSTAVQYADADLSSLVEERSRCHRQRAERPSPGRRLSELAEAPSPPHLGSRVHGSPTATGQFLGRVRKLEGLAAERPLTPRDVLVGHSFNGSQSLLLGHAGAVVAEVGGPLSHAAFVARQLGVPAVLGVGESSALLKEGDEVLVDGNEGVFVHTRGGLTRRE